MMVQSRLSWSEKLSLVGHVGSFTIPMDAGAPLSADTGPSPKELLLTAVLGCTAMDVLSLLKKNKQPVVSFEISGEADTRGEHPKIFTDLRVTYTMRGEIDAAQAIEACRLSMTKYCGVTAMISKVVPVHYTITVNDALVHSDVADFGL
jgi:putative redox protein